MSSFLDVLSASLLSIVFSSTATLSGQTFTVVGFLPRQVTWQGTVYPWHEYLLSCPGQPVHWLSESERNWSLGTEIPAGPIEYRAGARRIWASGRSYRRYDKSVAETVVVLGEFYWKVERLEEVAMRDLIAPPYTLSIERSMEMAAQEESGRARMKLGEVNMSVGTYTPHDDIEKAFKVSELPRSFSVAPNQPFPCDRTVYGYWLAILCALFLVYGIATMIKDKADGWLLIYAMFFASIIPIGASFVNHFFDVKRWSDSDFSPYATDD